jgi:lipoate-protein ligase A
LNFTVVLPVEADPRLRGVDTTQAYVLERSAEALRALGPDVRVLGSGDLTIDRRKISGSAQRRLRHWVMVHATILYGLDPAMISRYLRPPRRQPSYREGRAHGDFLTLLPLSREAIVGALRAAWPGAGESAPPLELAGRMVVEKFGRADWTGRL